MKVDEARPSTSIEASQVVEKNAEPKKMPSDKLDPGKIFLKLSFCFESSFLCSLINTIMMPVILPVRHGILSIFLTGHILICQINMCSNLKSMMYDWYNTQSVYKELNE